MSICPYNANLFGITSAVTSVTGSGAGINVTPTTGATVVSNTGVTSVVAGTGIGVSGATGAVTVSVTGGAVNLGALNYYSNALLTISGNDPLVFNTVDPVLANNIAGVSFDGTTLTNTSGAKIDLSIAITLTITTNATTPPAAPGDYKGFLALGPSTTVGGNWAFWCPNTLTTYNKSQIFNASLSLGAGETLVFTLFTTGMSGMVLGATSYGSGVSYLTVARIN